MHGARGAAHTTSHHAPAPTRPSGERSIDRQVRLDERRLVAGLGEQAGLVGGDRDAGAVAKLAAVELEGPVVPGADGAAVFDEAAGEVAAGVGAVVVDDVDLLALAEDGELEAAHLGVLANALFQLRQVTQGSPGHVDSTAPAGRSARPAGARPAEAR